MALRAALYRFFSRCYTRLNERRGGEGMGLELVDLDALVASLGDHSTPADLDALVVSIARHGLERQAEVPGFAPGARYEAGQRVWYQGEIAEVRDVRSQGNVRQGVFDRVALRMPDGTVKAAVAGVPGAPDVVLSPAVSEQETARAVEELGPQIRSLLFSHPRIARLLRATSTLQAIPYRTQSTPISGLGSSVRLEQAFAGLSDSDSALASAHFDSVSILWREMQLASQSRQSGQLPALETWRRFTEPVLRMLGWHMAPLPGGDFLLAPGPASVLAGSGAIGPDMGSSPLVVVVAVGWGTPLGFGAVAGEDDSPVFRVMGALAEAGVRWGLLTNGLRWRLYSATHSDPDTGSTASEAFELDLGALLDPSAGEAPHPSQLASFRRWWLLLRPDAFTPGPAGGALWAELRSETSTYARHVIRRLRERLFESVLAEIAGGFVAYRFHEREARAESARDLREIARASLGLVIRLLFMLVAEHRGLLPVANSGDQGQSMTALVRRALSAEDEGRPLSHLTQTTPLYEVLLALFRRLDLRPPKLDGGSYAGGIFTPVDVDYGFLARHRLSDRVVGRVLSALGRIDGTRVDYGALTLRHLSAVGEGLLEGRLHVVDAPSGHVVLQSASSTSQARRTAPLPDYMGAATTERALNHVLLVRGERYRTAMDRVVKLRHLVGTGSEQEGDADGLSSAEAEARDALLGLRVCDPAMGAGAFLVSALDALVDGILGCVGSYHRSHPWISWRGDPVVRTLREVRDALLAETGQQGLAVASEWLGDEVVLAWLLSQRALFGVDLDPAAVALSRTGVSMRAFLPGAPLPLLDDHLIEGNSLRGLRWDHVFPEIFPAPVQELDAATGTAVGFDVVISNPPAGSGALQALQGGESSFLELARRLACKPDGRIVLVMVPSVDETGAE
jgi:hypothetical protein